MRCEPHCAGVHLGHGHTHQHVQTMHSPVMQLCLGCGIRSDFKSPFQLLLVFLPDDHNFLLLPLAPSWNIASRFTRIWPVPGTPQWSVSLCEHIMGLYPFPYRWTSRWFPIPSLPRLCHNFAANRSKRFLRVDPEKWVVVAHGICLSQRD